MSGLRSRRKGHNFERLIATAFREAWPLATVRRGQQGDGAHEPDVVIDGDAPLTIRRLWIECQCANNPTPVLKLQQAERDAWESPAREVAVPLAVWHRSKEHVSWVTCRLGSLVALGLIAAASPPNLLSTMDFDAFLAALREHHPPSPF